MYRIILILTDDPSPSGFRVLCAEAPVSLLKSGKTIRDRNETNFTRNNVLPFFSIAAFREALRVVGDLTAFDLKFSNCLLLASQGVTTQLQRSLLVGVCSLVGLAPSAQAEDLYSPLESWNGEYLQQGYGGIYTRMKLEGFRKSKRGRAITTNVFIHLHEVKQGRRYVLSQAAAESDSLVPVWKIPAGNYAVQRVSLNDHTGRTRTWNGMGRLKLGVRHLFLSNMGLLTLQPEGEKGLKIRFQTQANSFKNQYEHQAFAGVVDAYSMKVQVELGGRELFQSAEQDFSSSSEARAAVSHQRQISMMYKVDLETERKLVPKVVSTVASQDLDLRRCYIDQLDQDESLQGQVGFRFQIARSSGAIQKISPQGDSIRSDRLVQCLILTLGRMQFPIASTINGSIIFYFSYKDDIGRSTPP